MSTPAHVFLPYQQRLWSAIDAHKVVVVEKSRRTGYSWALGAIAAAAAALARGAGGMDVLYMGYEKEMTREFIGYVADRAKELQLAASDVQETVFDDPERPEQAIKAFRVSFASGFEVVALPSVPRALRGKQGLVILDEAAFMDDLGEVLKAAFALLIWGGRVVVVSTHNGETNPFNALVNDIRAGRAPYHLERCTFEDAVRDGLYERICYVGKQVPSEAGKRAWVREIEAFYRDNADEELHVIPNPATGAWLPAPLIEARMSASPAVVRWSAPAGFALEREEVRQRVVAIWCEAELRPVLDRLDPSCPHAFGEDFGRVRDLTVVWLLAIGRTMERRTPLVVELRGCPFEQQRQILFYVLDRVPRLRAGAMDAGGNGMYLAEVTAQRYGERVQQVMLNEPWYREHMPPLKAAIEDAVIELPRDRDIGDDLRGLKLVRGVARVPERTRGDDRLSRHGDAAIALALAYAASCAEPEEYGYEAVRPALGAYAPRASAPGPLGGTGWPIERELADEVGGSVGRRDLHGYL